MAQWTTTYAGLVSLLETYVEDDSTEFGDAVQGCINRAEERIFRDLDVLIWNTTASSTTDNGTDNFTKSFSGAPVISLFFSAANDFAERRSREFLRMYGSTGRPRYFYEDADKVYFAPTPDDSYAYVVEYVARPTPLSGSNTTNWFTINVADLLLYAALVESEKFLIAPERVQEFEATYQQLLGPVRAFWRQQQQLTYEPVAPTPKPIQTR